MEKETKTKFTPGPYRLAEDAQGICGLMHPKKHGVAIAWFSSCHVPAKGYAGDDERAGKPERQATALLFNAASELYEALKGCVAVLERMDTISHVSPEFPALDKARAALHKAEKGEGM